MLNKTAASTRLSPDNPVLPGYLHAAGGLRLQQLSSHSKNIRQCAKHKQRMRIFIQPAIARFRVTEHALDHAEHMLDPHPYARLGAIARLLTFGQGPVARRFLLREVARVRCSDFHRILLSHVRRVAPDTGLVSVDFPRSSGHAGVILWTSHALVDTPELFLDFPRSSGHAGVILRAQEEVL